MGNKGSKPEAKVVRLLKDPPLNAMPYSQIAQQVFKQNCTTCPLLTLPSEIRNRIFAEALGGYLIMVSVRRTINQQGSVPLLFDEFSLSENPSPSAIAPYRGLRDILIIKISALDCRYRYSISNPFASLQQTCRQVYMETALVPFSRVNDFWFAEDVALRMMAWEMRSVHFHSIAKIVFPVCEKVGEPSEFGDFDLGRLKNLSLLKRLQLVQVSIHFAGCNRCRNAVVMPEWVRDDALQRIRQSLGRKIKAAAPEGFKLVFEMQEQEAQEWVDAEDLKRRKKVVETMIGR
ncbi:hypothetical protein P3342_010808 [Pyrenophora teres f. teres]|uniref:Uncharacterized protein n=2 Tax=Pyrenophora teres f. teres TaxID=97479 RepID=E3RXD4_PYRTT|nr:hypothetical protein PTT_14040 [Pyrenophora teres f. teres 0-1]KAE8829107.1 hypothetical protein PTNB85_08295 [Pyrenophora teres f. teres]KAE8830267.1 hypothetical protein HRS9139_06891 [Pyrenophora teres f. teres]KAE8859494.1 hypothetical protein PTNB29_06725 [Pyrenophora teres f. teres]KAE8864877.1 hypothetical protein PTNB73_05765 [Pyrenophora teres f. teres]